MEKSGIEHSGTLNKYKVTLSASKQIYGFWKEW